MANPCALIFFEESDLTKELINQLLEKNVFVILGTSEVYKKRLIQERENLLILNFLNEKEKILRLDPDYIICFLSADFIRDLPLEKTNLTWLDREKIELSIELARLHSSKLLLVYNYSTKKSVYWETFPVVEKEYLEKGLYPSIIFLGDLISAKTNGYFKNNLNEVLEDAIKRGKVDLSLSQVFYPISISKAVSLLLRALFSLRAYGKKTAILGRPLPAASLGNFLEKKNCRVNLLSNESYEYGEGITADYNFFGDENIENLISKAWQNFLEIEEPKKSAVMNKLKPIVFWNALSFKARITSFNFWKLLKTPLRKNWLSLGVAFIIAVFLIPFLIILVTVFTNLLSLRIIKAGYLKQSEILFKVTTSVSIINKNYSLFLSKIPLIRFYKELSDVSYLLESESKIGARIVRVTDVILKLGGKIIGTESYDVGYDSENISLELGFLYQELGFLDGEAESLNPISQKVVKTSLGRLDNEHLREKINLLRQVFSELPDLLGKVTPKKYLVLFQDSSVLRPTGGVIPVFSIVTFSDGRMIDYKVYESGFVDANLKGNVEIPPPLKKYFRQERWAFSDSNWDPDFTTSAVQAEWFIEKALDEQIFGVIGVDKKTFERIVPIDFFNKDELNAELFENLKENLLLSSDRVKLEKLNLVLDAFENKDFLVFVNNQNVQRIFSELNWDGAVTNVTCLQNCYSDFISVIESSVEGDNTLVVRESQLSVYIEEGLIKRKLNLFFDNKGEHTYKLYLRVLTNPEVGFSPLEIVAEGDKKFSDLETKGIRGFKEAGAFVEIPAKRGVALSFSWEGGSDFDFTNEGRYEAFLRKQPGVVLHPVELIVSFPVGVRVLGDKEFSLTDDGGLRYNTSLSEDENIKFFWK